MISEKKQGRPQVYLLFLKQVAFSDPGAITFPSITICRKYIFDEPPGVLNQIKSENFKEEEVKLWFKNHTRQRQDIVSFLSHSTLGERLQLPCNTVDGPRAGNPCAFPFYYPDCNLLRKSGRCKKKDPINAQMYTKCIKNGDMPWCSTRNHWNNSHIIGEYAYCSQNCTSESMHRIQAYNPASSGFEKLWEEGLYDLDMYGAGHCFTYNPEYSSLAGYKGELYILLGKLN